MSLAIGTSLLRGRYEIRQSRSISHSDAVAWMAINEDGVRHLVKTWSYEGDEPDRVQRALWDAELRTLYKVGSSPGASDAPASLRTRASTVTAGASLWSWRRLATRISARRWRQDGRQRNCHQHDPLFGRPGVVRVWADDGHMVCDISDGGHIADPLMERLTPTILGEHGRGLLVINYLCDLVRIYTEPGSTSIRLFMQI